MASIIPMSLTWLAWAAIARRLWSRYGDTSTARCELDLRCAERVAVVHRPVRVEVLVVVGLRHQLAAADHEVAVERGLVAPRRAGEVGGAVADPVDLDVIGVAVVAVPVVEHDDVGRLGPQDRRPAARAASSTSARQNAPSSAFWAQPVIPESR